MRTIASRNLVVPSPNHSHLLHFLGPTGGQVDAIFVGAPSQFDRIRVLLFDYPRVDLPKIETLGPEAFADIKHRPRPAALAGSIGS